MQNHIDIIVVGAGPVGLLTAIELTLGGARVLVLERLAAPSLVAKALGIGPLGSEALERRGLATAIAAEEARGFAVRGQAGADVRGRASKSSGHFAGLAIRKDAQKEPERRMRLVDQQSVEAMLADGMRALGIEIRRGCEVTGFTQQADGIDVEWTSPSGANHIRCAYLIGCDGGHSLIRKLAGFDFPGTPPTLTMYQAVVEIDHPEQLMPLDHDDFGSNRSKVMKRDRFNDSERDAGGKPVSTFPHPARGWHRTLGGVFAYGFFPGRLVMLDFSGPPEDRQTPVTREEIETLLRHISGKDVRVKALESGSRWADNTRLADTYRRGRVLLAGDAAHVHSPFGGQGLSLGLVDAANLGWKLAAVIRGEMPESLLDTYTAERRPVAEAVLSNTLAQTAILRPDPQSGAMRDIVAKLMQCDEANRLLGEMMSGLSTRYDLGSELDEVGRLIGDRPIRHGGAQVSLYDMMQDGRGVLLDASAGGKASNLVAAATQRISCVAVDTGPSMLIRPDACIAWVGEENSTDGLEEALRRWFGPTPDDRPGL